MVLRRPDRAADGRRTRVGPRPPLSNVDDAKAPAADSAPALSSWLRCPLCAHGLEDLLPLTLGCDNGHRFDVNKRGYVTLLGSGSKLMGDSAEMLDARDAVLEAGTFSVVAHAVAEAAAGRRILDAGAGTGHYLRKTLAAHPDAIGLAMDLSPTAVARAVRSSPRIRGLVADTWRSLPVRTAAVDTVLNVFAPRNLPEFHRVLKTDGILVVVVPRADHLAELREDAGMLDIPSDKADSVISAAEPLFALATDEHIAAPLELDPALAAALVGMGPSARHTAAASSTVRTTSLSVDVLSFRRRDVSG